MSPLVFSLYMDCLEVFVTKAISTWPDSNWDDVWVIGVLVPLLLFANDLVLLAWPAWVVHCLLALLSTWCHHMGLMVLLSKTKWLVGGFHSAKRSDFADPGAGVTLRYWESTL